jgi:hypothetical protein
MKAELDDASPGYANCRSMTRRYRAMVDFLANPGAVSVLLMFIWVPFALGAYLVDIWRPAETRRSLEKLGRRIRHTERTRPMTTADAH